MRIDSTGVDLIENLERVRISNSNDAAHVLVVMLRRIEEVSRCGENPMPR
jgi:hypothetical protein